MAKKTKKKKKAIDGFQGYERTPIVAKDISNEALESLLVAIINQAWQDLLYGCYYLSKNQADDYKYTKKQMRAMQKETDARRFFNSDWFTELTNDNVNSDWVFWALNKIMSLESKYDQRTASNIIKKKLESAIIY